MRGGTTEPLEDLRPRKDGSWIYVQTTMSPVRDERGNIILVSSIMRDITERKKAEEELRELTRRLLETEETERRRLNRELHDRIGSNLSALGLGVGLLRSQLPKDALPAVDARLDGMQTLVEAAARDARDIMAELHPPALDDYGLLAALQAHASVVSARSAVAVQVTGADPSRRLPIAVETALFRIAQESLNNAVKHSGATQVRVELGAGAEQLRLVVADDGAGFDATMTLGEATWGMRTMRERALAVGAEFSVESAPGRGTRVTVALAFRDVQDTGRER